MTLSDVRLSGNWIPGVSLTDCNLCGGCCSDRANTA